MITQQNFKFALSDEIYWKWAKDEALLCIISGELGSGKSSCAIQMLREIYPNGDEWKKYLVFKPEDFLNLIDELMMQEPPKKVPLIVWDDAGLWLYAMEWSDPRVIAVVKFINVMRTVVGGLILTTPAEEMIVSKIPMLSGTRRATVTEYHAARSSPMRRFSVAKTIKTKWGKKFVKDYIEDFFNVMLPQNVYNYYKPLRDQYAREANELMRQAWRDRLAKKQAKAEKTEKEMLPQI